MEKEPRYDDIVFDKRKEKTPEIEKPNLDYLDDQTLLETDFSDSEKDQFLLESTVENAREVLEQDLSDKFIEVTKPV